MTSDVKTMETPENLPAETSVPQDLLGSLEYARRLRAKGQGFYQGTVNLPRYTKHLIGEGFFITSDPLYKTMPKTDKRDFASDVVQFTIRVIGVNKLGSPVLLAPELATLQGAFLLNQVKSMTINELHGYPWTVAENGLFVIREQADGRTHPYMLELYDPRVHQPVSEASEPVVRVAAAQYQEVFTQPAHDERAKAFTRDAWTAFNTQLRAAGLSLSDARRYLEMGDEESWTGRDLVEDWTTVKALSSAPEETEARRAQAYADFPEPRSPQEQIVGGAGQNGARGRGRPRKDTVHNQTFNPETHTFEQDTF